MTAATAIPIAQTAITQHADGILKVAHGIPVASVKPGLLLVRNAFVALNPCDFKMAARFPTQGLLDGVDFSGTVVDAGPDVGGFKIGDRVFGCVPGNKQDDPASGSFCEFVKVEAIYAWRIPDDMTFDTASALCAACIVTIGLTMHSYLKMEVTPEPTADGRPRGTILVYGGSSSVGLVAIQLLKM
jgi:NADPH:quinone reductase-like Zn-dependent oxidoreductase